MDRHYYGLKALMMAAGLAVAIFMGHFGAPRLAGSMADMHYGAAASVQMAATHTLVEASNAVVHFVRKRAHLSQ